MELTRDASIFTKRVKKYDSNLYVKWIPATYVDEKGLVNVCEHLQYAIPSSGRWAIFYKNINTGEETIRFIIETDGHKYRELSENDLYRLRSSDMTALGRGYNVFDEVARRNKEKEEKEKKAYYEYNREKAKDMYNFVTNTPYITSGVQFDKEGRII